ncbi:MAG TPA: hypothetical protein VFW44_04900 [Bryobacteraceae bacterium]|nr:hypothetical protein [Bryobacteraceae bacterium]
MIIGAATSQAQTYNVTDLGVTAGANQSFGGGINSLGQAAGTSSNAANSSSGIATLFKSGQAIDLGALAPSDESFGSAISDAGEVAGYDYLGTRQSASHAVVWNNGKISDIHSDALFPFGSDALGVNDAGTVVGYGWPDTADLHAFVYSNGKMVELGTFGGSNSLAHAVNNSGQVVGWSMTSSGVTHAFLYSNGELRDLGVPSGASSTTAIAIASNGEILGLVQVGSNTEISRYSNGTWTQLGTGVAGTVNTLASAINSSGQIVGSATFPGVYSPRNARKPAIPIGFVYVNGAFVDLNTMIPANSGFHIAAALAINDSGEILCNATNSNGQMHAAVLTPR